MGHRILVVLLAMGMAATMVAQDSTQLAQASPEGARPKIYRIAVNVQSRDARVKLINDDLNRDAAGVVERSAKNVYPIIVTGSKAEAAEQARRENADYLLVVEFAPHSSASVAIGPGANRPRDSEIYGAPRANMEGEMFLAWTVEPMNGNKVRLHDSRYLNHSEYPLSEGPIAPNYLADIAHESVRTATAAAMSKLKLKKGLDLKLDVTGMHGH